MGLLIRCPAVLSLHLMAGQADRKPLESHATPRRSQSVSPPRGSECQSMKAQRTKPLRLQTSHFALLYLFISCRSTFMGSRQELSCLETHSDPAATHCRYAHQLLIPPCARLSLTKTQSGHVLDQLLVQRALGEGVGK